tara:strand:+ start:24251 stop:25357 length:1107 start_codon:yes stop_codon:yes gene_type:complete
MLLTTLFYIFLIAVLIQFGFYVFIFGKFSFLKKQKTTPNNFPISVIIAAKNEALNLIETIPAILDQNYIHFELILINDASSDETLKIMQSFEAQNDCVKIITIEASSTYNGNKKNALSKGIEVATFSHLLFTDADCKPLSENWITEMASNFTNTKKIVLGYGAHQKINNSFLNKFIRYETLITAIQYFSYAQLGIPYMGVGRNLAYHKSLYLQNNGFESHEHIKSGDDDLLISEIATQQNTAICFSKDSFTRSAPKATIRQWFLQKRRHISTASIYKPIHQFLLGLFFSSQLLFWCLAIILLVCAFNWFIVIPLVLIRLITQYIIFTKSALKLDEKDLIVFIPVLDFLLVFAQLSLFITNLASKPKHW